MSAWYRSGTIAVAGKTVTGTGTNWTDNKMGIGPGQALLIPGAGTVKVYEISRVDSATQLTLNDDAGTVAAGQAYAIMSFYGDSVPDFARRLSAQLSYYQSQMDGWQEIMTGTGSITLEAPDGTQVTVSSFKKLTTDMAAKADKTALDGKADKVDGAVPVSEGGTGSTTAAGALANLGGVASTDSRLKSVDGKSGGSISTPVNVAGGISIVTQPSSYAEFSFIYPSTLKKMAFAFCENYGDIVFVTTAATVVGTDKYFSMRQNGNFNTQGNISCASLTQTSDADKKDQIETIPDARAKIRELRGVTYVLKESGMPAAGVIAQELMPVLPEAIGAVFDEYDQYEEVEEQYEVETTGENGEPVTVTETRMVTRLKKPRDESKRSYTVDYAAVTGLVLQTAVELDQAVLVMEQKQANMEAFLKTLGYEPDTNYTSSSSSEENQ
ncbi:tail fiber domain-containing protein [Cronobacter sakazakii]|nr:tail fiber domain-containing protein [Cronobacter sakazakii]